VVLDFYEEPLVPVLFKKIEGSDSSLVLEKKFKFRFQFYEKKKPLFLFLFVF
jgi:hypothetical protein